MASQERQDPVPGVAALSARDTPAPRVGLKAPRGSGASPEAAPALPRRDTVEISLAARAAAAPATGDAGDLKFSYDPATGTLQTQVVNPRTGKPILEFPSDAQIQLRKKLHETLSGDHGSADQGLPDPHGR